MKQAVIYARSASSNEDSIRIQIVLGKKFAADNGYTVVRVFVTPMHRADQPNALLCKNYLRIQVLPGIPSLSSIAPAFSESLIYI